jgi:hypothetical protein
MSEQRIEPHKVTKPIQLLAAWLVGLVVTNASFLMAAIQMATGSWERGALVVSTIVNVPIFLLALFVLQTRFRAELQEDTFYAEYLSKKSSAVIRVDKDSSQDAKLDEIERTLASLAAKSDADSVNAPPPTDPEKSSALDWSHWPVALNHIHPRFREVRDALRVAGIPLTTIFGDDGDVPNKWIISLSHQLPVSHKASLLRAVLPFGFDGIQFWTPRRDADENEEVYIGSYGDGPYAKVTEELSKLLDAKVEAVDFHYYYRRNKAVRQRLKSS